MTAGERDPLAPSMRLNGAIAAFALAMIAASLVLRFGFRASEAVSEAPLLATLALGGAPLVFHIARRLLAREFGADSLAALSIVTAVLLHEYLAGSIIVLMLSGGVALEEYAVQNASSVLKALIRRMPSLAHRRERSSLEDVPVEEVRPGDVLTVFPHEICPVDGTVIEGHGTMDEAYLTGEPFAIDKAPGSDVISGAVNGDMALTIRATRPASDSRYAKIVEVMRAAERNRPRIRRIADRLGAFYAPVSLAVAGAAWAASGDPSRFLSVLVVATPCPLLIGVPVAVIGAVSSCAKRGIVVRNAQVFEEIENCRVAIFDKTGTLTYGEPSVSEVVCRPGMGEDEALSLAASVERYSKHPLAVAVNGAVREKGIVSHEASEIREVPGEGLRGVVEGREIFITNRERAAALSGQALPPPGEGLECVMLVDGAFAAAFRFRDTPRAEGRSFIQHLGPRHSFDRTLIVSGDRESEVRYLAAKVGIDQLHAGKTPEEKVGIVREETRRAKTLFVGDGINDAPALAAATVGIAIGRHSDIAGEAAMAVVMDSSLAKVDELMHISRKMKTVALQSAIGGMALSGVAMVAASLGWIEPTAGALAQEAIDLTVILNALRTAFPPKELSDF